MPSVGHEKNKKFLHKNTEWKERAYGCTKRRKRREKEIELEMEELFVTRGLTQLYRSHRRLEEQELRRQSNGCSREQRCLLYVRQPKEEHKNTLKTKTDTTMRPSTIRKSINVCLHRRQINRRIHSWCAFGKKFRIMNSLRTRADLLSAKENIIWVCIPLQ